MVVSLFLSKAGLVGAQEVVHLSRSEIESVAKNDDGGPEKDALWCHVRASLHKSRASEHTKAFCHEPSDGRRLIAKCFSCYCVSHLKLSFSV